MDEDATSREPKFPLNSFPPELEEIIYKLVSVSKFNADITAGAFLFAISTAIGNTYRININTTWIQPGSLFITAIARSGTGKSHPFDFAVKPIGDKREEYYQRYQNEMREYELALKDDKNSVKPILTRNLIQAHTVQVLNKTLSENHRGLGLYEDELIGFLGGMNQFNKGNDTFKYLEFWEGRSLSTDTLKDGHTFIRDPFLSIGGTIQPGLLKELASKDKGENGFIPRWLFIYPENMRSNELTNEFLNPEIVKSYKGIINTLLEIELETDLNTGIKKPKELKYTDEAYELYLDWYNKDLNPRKNNPDEFDYCASYSKLHPYFHRFCLIFKVLEIALRRENDLFIGANIINRVIPIIEYFRLMAVKVIDDISGNRGVEKLPEKQQVFYNSLPDEPFKTQIAIQKGNEAGYKKSRIHDLLKKPELFEKLNHGYYQKIS